MNETNETINVTGGGKVQTRDDARMRVKKIAFIGLMGAVSAVLMLFRFPIPFMPPFLSFDFSGLMEMLGGFMFGPVAALCIIIVKIMLQLVMQGSFSLGTGELQNLILSCTYGGGGHGGQFAACGGRGCIYKSVSDHSILCKTVRHVHGRHYSHVQYGEPGGEKRGHDGSVWHSAVQSDQVRRHLSCYIYHL